MITAIVAVVAIAAAAWWIRAGVVKALSRRGEDQALALLQSQMNAAAQQSGQQIDQMRGVLQQMSTTMAQSLADSGKTVGERLDRAAQVIAGVSKQLGQLEESTRHIFEVGKSISGLEAVLRAPKLRGSLGELFLEELLAQILPPGYYRTQYAFKDGQTVDAVVCLKSGLVPVDAKFPLENFRRAVQAANEEEGRAARRQFIRDVKKHIDDIAEKYIRTDEGTFDFALMYIPAENVYYETIVKEDEASGEMALFGYALGKRVIPVSPNSFYAYLQTILLGLKGMRVEESAREMINDISRLKKEFEKFGEAFGKLGGHLDNSAKQYAEAEKRLGKIEGKMEQIEGLAGHLPPGQPPMLEPPAA